MPDADGAPPAPGPRPSSSTAPRRTPPRRRARLLAVVVIAVVAVVVGIGVWQSQRPDGDSSSSGGPPLGSGHPVPVPHGPCVVSASLVDPCRPWVGAAANDYPQVPAATADQLAYHERRIGRRLDIVHTYHEPGTDALTPTDVAYATRPDTILFADWKPANRWADAAGGDAAVNARIDTMAASIKALGTHRIFLTISHEPENDVTDDPNCPGLGYQGTAGTPSDYRAMWANVEARFAADGVHNVVWVLDLMNYPRWNCLIPDLYPGNRLVDWIMFNAYAQPAQQNFVANVRRFQDLLTKDTDADHDFTAKTWGIAEWGDGFGSAQQQIDYIDEARAAVADGQLPRIHSYSVFDSNNGNGDGAASGVNLRVGYDNDGRADATKARAYARFANDRHLTVPFTLPDASAPQLRVYAPALHGGATLSGTAKVAVTISGPRPAVDVQLYVDGRPAGPARADPGAHPQLSLPTSGLGTGLHTVWATATDTAGDTAASPPALVTVGG